MPRPSLTDDMGRPIRVYALADLPASDDPVPQTARIPFDSPIDCVDDFRRPSMQCPHASSAEEA